MLIHTDEHRKMAHLVGLDALFSLQPISSYNFGTIFSLARVLSTQNVANTTKQPTINSVLVFIVNIHWVLSKFHCYFFFFLKFSFGIDVSGLATNSTLSDLFMGDFNLFCFGRCVAERTSQSPSYYIHVSKYYRLLFSLLLASFSYVVYCYVFVYLLGLTF